MKDKKKHIDLLNRDRKLSYKVPENYFEQLPNQIQKKLNDNNRSHQRIFNPFLLKRVGIAFSLVFVLTTSIYFLNKTSVIESENCIDLACVSDSEIEAYYDDMYELNEEEIMDQAVKDLDIQELYQIAEPIKVNNENLKPEIKTDIIIDQDTESDLYEIELDDELLDELSIEDINELI